VATLYTTGSRATKELSVQETWPLLRGRCVCVCVYVHVAPLAAAISNTVPCNATIVVWSQLIASVQHNVANIHACLDAGCVLCDSPISGNEYYASDNWVSVNRRVTWPVYCNGRG
jgi:hypothetical protein